MEFNGELRRHVSMAQHKPLYACHRGGCKHCGKATLGTEDPLTWHITFEDGSGLHTIHIEKYGRTFNNNTRRYFQCWEDVWHVARAGPGPAKGDPEPAGETPVHTEPVVGNV